MARRPDQPLRVVEDAGQGDVPSGNYLSSGWRCICTEAEVGRLRGGVFAPVELAEIQIRGTPLDFGYEDGEGVAQA